MALTSTLGTGSLLQLGVSLGDIAVLVQGGRRLGNWLFVDKHDDDLFSSINELPVAVLKRRGLINPTKWSPDGRQSRYCTKGGGLVQQIKKLEMINVFLSFRG
jgi:hypothetical protein